MIWVCDGMSDADCMAAVLQLHQNQFFLSKKPGVSEDFAEYMERVKMMPSQT